MSFVRGLNEISVELLLVRKIRYSLVITIFLFSLGGFIRKSLPSWLNLCSTIWAGAKNIIIFSPSS